MKRSDHNSAGFSLIEVLMIIVALGIVAATAMQYMTTSVEDLRRIKTEREMEALARAIAGDPGLSSNGVRSDFGYVGNVGAFPPNLAALSMNPGGFSTWKGPYLPPGFVQDSRGAVTDEWGAGYNYSGGTIITSTGSGETISKKMANAASDYLYNSLDGTIKGSDDTPPGTAYKDSVEIKITVPDGSGGTQMKTCSPDSAGTFSLDSLPVGRHPLRIIYTPEEDTLLRYVTILPRNKDSREYRFAFNHFSPATGCGGAGSLILRPEGVGTVTELTTIGCSANWQCVSEIASDEDATRVNRASATWGTDLYAIEDPTVMSCSVEAVTVYCRARKEQNQGSIKPIILTYGTEYEGTEQPLTTSYENYSYRWAVNPNTSAAWTWQEIIDLECGLKLKGQNPTRPAYCTQVWVEVSYSN